MLRIALILLFFGVACSSPPTSTPDADSTPDSGIDVGADAAASPDAGGDMSAPDMPVVVEPVDYPSPPERWPAESSITNDVDTDLAALLETDRINGACDRWNDGARDDETKLLCGKWMFFYETFGTVGIPRPILAFAQRWYAEYYGAGFSNFGFVPDPASDEGMPLGLAETTGTFGDVETLAFTCASCHFGQMADGRYAVGYGNLSLDYGRFIATLGAPMAMSIDEDDPTIHPNIRAELLPYVQAANADPDYFNDLATTGLALLEAGADMPSTSIDDQARFLGLRPGTMDFLTEPLVDDGVWTVSRILSLWNLPSAGMRVTAGMDHERLAWSGGATNLQNFISGFVAIGVADVDVWTPDRIAPLEAYIRSLRTPELQRAIDPDAAARGAEAFEAEGCVGCHNGPSGESAIAYSFDEIGTDPAMAMIFNPDAMDVLCCGFDDGGEGSYEVTRGVKAPRIVGVENQSSWLHNGSVPSLESLLCIEPRPMSTREAQGAEGHEYGCELDETIRLDLIEYLRGL